MPSPAAATVPAPPLASAPATGRNVVALGFTSLLTDVSTEMIVPVLPGFVTGTLRASVASLCVIEGVAECTATVLRIFSGWLSDRIGRRKAFMLFGYGLSTVAKGTMALAASWGAVVNPLAFNLKKTATAFLSQVEKSLAPVAPFTPDSLGVTPLSPTSSSKSKNH